MRFSTEVSVTGLLAVTSAASVTGRGAAGTVCAPRTIALGLASASTSAQQRITWGRATLRAAAALVAALSGLLILRGERKTQPRRLATGSRLIPARHGGRERRVATPLDQVSDQAPPGLLAEPRALAIRKRR